MFEQLTRTVQIAKEIQFVNPNYFHLFAIVFILFVFVAVALWVFLLKRPVRTHGSKYSLGGNTIFRVFMVVSMCFAIVALARPVTTFPIESYSTGSVDFIAVVDISSSMWADDIKPSRLDIVRRELLNMDGVLKEGDRASLIVFGAKPSTRAYITGELPFFFNEVAVLGPPSFITLDRFAWGSDVSGTLREVYLSADILDRFLSSENAEEFINSGDEPAVITRRDNRFVVFFTDADFSEDEMLSGIMREAFSELLARGISVHVVGVGTRNGVNLLSSIRRMKSTELVWNQISKEIAGITTALKPANLSALTSGTGEGYFIIDNEGTTAKDFLSKTVNSYRSGTERVIPSEGVNEFWHYFIMLSLIFIILAIIFY